jgi:carbon-monoxide dehydrogenase large subunit/6-hydroxypseudooxynicotine dehydrogenase subunit gamma
VRRRQARGARDGRAVGVGLAAFVEKAGSGPWEYASVEVDTTGLIRVATGGSSVGQGIATILSQIVADELGVALEQIDVLHGDTARVPYGSGAFASRVAIVGGSAALRAAAAVRERALRVAADLLEAAPSDLELSEATLRVRGSPTRAVTLAEVAAACQPGQRLAGETPGLRAEAFYTPVQPTYPGGVHACEVAVDLETGTVGVERYVITHDVGRAINPKLVAGQLQGGMAQGLGGALLEALVYDDDGQLLTTSFVDYLLPTSEEVPAASVICVDSSAAADNPLGAKGAGESGCTGAGACIANAVADALGSAGARLTRLPLSPSEVHRLLSAK